MPDSLAKLGPDGAALLVETRAADASALAAQVAAATAALATTPTYEPVRFSTDPAECARFWNVRKGMFPSVGAMRAVGTTVIIEDVAFPVPRLAEATLELQQLLRTHGYADAIIFGHALAGNLHFRISAGSSKPGAAEKCERSRGLMDALAGLVVEHYEGRSRPSTGPGDHRAFVETRVGDGRGLHVDAAGSRRCSIPKGLLNPGVLLNADPRCTREFEAAAAMPIRSSISASNADSASRRARRAG